MGDDVWRGCWGWNVTARRTACPDKCEQGRCQQAAAADEDKGFTKGRKRHSPSFNTVPSKYNSFCAARTALREKPAGKERRGGMVDRCNYGPKPFSCCPLSSFSCFSLKPILQLPQRRSARCPALPGTRAWSFSSTLFSSPHLSSPHPAPNSFEHPPKQAHRKLP